MMFSCGMRFRSMASGGLGAGEAEAGAELGGGFAVAEEAEGA
jgi:hypothetical protein